MFHGAHDFSVSGDAHFLNVGKQKNFHITNSYSGTKGLDILKEFVSFKALHDSYVQDPERRCHPGTRESVLKWIGDWIDNPRVTERVFWLHGPAGVGKSSIAQTISRTHGPEKVVATFFFYRSDTNRNDGNLLFPTLAWQLAKSIPDVRERIASALNKDPDIPRKEIEAQFEHLIALPLQAIATTQLPPPIVVIDGLDECLDERLQRRFLNILRKATIENHIPLRFLISSRPEAHIKDVFHQFDNLMLDLADVDDAHYDIEKYFKFEFTRIASEQDLDPVTWPGEDIIEDLVFRSSGQFVYASTVIKFVGDDYNSATSQLDIILGLELLDGKSPYAVLDALYLEILQRQPDQVFLKIFLGLLLSNCDPGDYALLMKVDEKGLLRKLRGMHSVLRINTKIEVYHKSFLDFVQEPLRSRRYSVSQQSGTRLYLDLIVGTLVRCATKVLKEPSCHGNEHFSPEFSNTASQYPRWIELPLQDWEEALSPLLKLKDELLKLSNLNSFSAHGLCNKCRVVFTLDALLLHLACYRGASHIAPSPLPEQDIGSEFPVNLAEEAQSTLDNIDSDFPSSLPLLSNGHSYASDSESPAVVHFLRTLLRDDHIKVASKVRSALNAQNMVDLIRHAINNKDLLTQCGSNAKRNATRLALGIYARVPLVPRLFLDPTTLKTDYFEPQTIAYRRKYQGKPVAIWARAGYGINPLCHTALIWGTISHENIYPLLGIYETALGAPSIAFVTPYPENGTLLQWRGSMCPSIVEIRERMLEVAEALRYMHSLDIVLAYRIGGNHIILDSNFHAQIPGFCLSLQYCRDRPSERSYFDWKYCTYEGNTLLFGYILYEVYFNLERSVYVKRRPRKPEIAENAWQLIQKCCADNPEARPTMDQVVEEMKSWKPA